MSAGDKRAYTDKQKRQASNIADSYQARGTDTSEAASRAWATVNKQTGGGKQSGSGRKAPTATDAAARRGKPTGRPRTQ